MTVVKDDGYSIGNKVAIDILNILGIKEDYVSRVVLDFSATTVPKVTITRYLSDNETQKISRKIKFYARPEEAT